MQYGRLVQFSDKTHRFILSKMKASIILITTTIPWLIWGYLRKIFLIYVCSTIILICFEHYHSLSNDGLSMQGFHCSQTPCFVTVCSYACKCVYLLLNQACIYICIVTFWSWVFNSLKICSVEFLFLIFLLNLIPDC